MKFKLTCVIHLSIITYLKSPINFIIFPSESYVYTIYVNNTIFGMKRKYNKQSLQSTTVGVAFSSLDSCAII
jgi:hypothetical protein